MKKSKHKPSIPKCFFCHHNIDSMPHRCKFCKEMHCDKHILPEDHKCSKLSSGKWGYVRPFEPREEKRRMDKLPVFEVNPIQPRGVYECEKCGLEFEDEKEAVKHEKGCGKKNYLLTVFIIFLILLIGYNVYTIIIYDSNDDYDGTLSNLNDYHNTNSYIQDINPTIALADSKKKDISDKYVHFDTKDITYAITGFVKSSKRTDIREGLKIIEQEVGEFNFTEVSINDNPLLIINITNSETIGDRYESLGIATPEVEDGIITGGFIDYSSNWEGACLKQEYPDTIIHEVFHILGFSHNDGTIMQAESIRCSKLNHLQNKPYVEHLRYIYSNGERGVEHPELPLLEDY